MTENVQKTGLSECNAHVEVTKRLFRHTQEPLCRLRRTLPVKRMGILAMSLVVGFMCACKPAKEVANIPSVKKSEKLQVNDHLLSRWLEALTAERFVLYRPVDNDDYDRHHTVLALDLDRCLLP